MLSPCDQYVSSLPAMAPSRLLVWTCQNLHEVPEIRKGHKVSFCVLLSVRHDPPRETSLWGDTPVKNLNLPLSPSQVDIFLLT